MAPALVYYSERYGKWFHRRVRRSKYGPYEGDYYAVLPGLPISMTYPQHLRSQVRVGGFLVQLTPQQADVLTLLMLRRGCYVSRNTIIEWLWPDPDFEPDYASNMVSVHITRLQRKTGISIHTGTRIGYMLPKPKSLQLPTEDLHLDTCFDHNFAL